MSSSPPYLIELFLEVLEFAAQQADVCLEFLHLDVAAPLQVSLPLVHQLQTLRYLLRALLKNNQQHNDTDT